ncbi:hypothetical protein NHP21005_16820 [Helicobacter sp. NHP21005]|uniref:hypothetical protein n=1 Tax=Helicobacter felistomachi TaxID=3040201 RepID=UPI002574526F|nr:hypothetical protein [Helicobacter sp. NHP21005]BEG57994.1 hypothetical protein NHP21005_16820 [Helicobacter sp. NHP21005]
MDKRILLDQAQEDKFNRAKELFPTDMQKLKEHPIQTGALKNIKPFTPAFLSSRRLPRGVPQRFGAVLKYTL